MPVSFYHVCISEGVGEKALGAQRNCIGQTKWNDVSLDLYPSHTEVDS